MLNNIITKNNSVNKKNKTFLYIATLVALTISSLGNSVYASNTLPIYGQVENIKLKKQTYKPFTIEEYALILEKHRIYGPKWSEIAEHIPGRNRRQIRERYINYLDPNINHEPFTPQEDALILERYKTYGPKWSEIAKHIPGRAYMSIRSRFKNLSRQAKKANIPNQPDQIQNLDILQTPAVNENNSSVAVDEQEEDFGLFRNLESDFILLGDFEENPENLFSNF